MRKTLNENKQRRRNMITRSPDSSVIDTNFQSVPLRHSQDTKITHCRGRLHALHWGHVCQYVISAPAVLCQIEQKLSNTLRIYVFSSDFAPLNHPTIPPLLWSSSHHVPSDTDYASILSSAVLLMAMLPFFSPRSRKYTDCLLKHAFLCL